MSFVKKKRSVLRVFSFIFNNLIQGFEIWDKVSGTLKGVENAAGEVMELTDDAMDDAGEVIKGQRGMLSKDYVDAVRYVDEGVSTAKDVWLDLKKAF